MTSSACSQRFGLVVMRVDAAALGPGVRRSARAPAAARTLWNVNLCGRERDADRVHSSRWGDRLPQSAASWREQRRCRSPAPRSAGRWQRGAARPRRGFPPPKTPRPNPQMQSDRPISARLRAGGTFTGCDKEALICVGTGYIGPAADLHSVRPHKKSFSDRRHLTVTGFRYHSPRRRRITSFAPRL